MMSVIPPQSVSFGNYAMMPMRGQPALQFPSSQQLRDFVNHAVWDMSSHTAAYIKKCGPGYAKSVMATPTRSRLNTPPDILGTAALVHDSNLSSTSQQPARVSDSKPPSSFISGQPPMLTRRLVQRQEAVIPDSRELMARAIGGYANLMDSGPSQSRQVHPVDRPLFVDCSIEYDLPNIPKPPEGCEPILMVHPVFGQPHMHQHHHNQQPQHLRSSNKVFFQTPYVQYAKPNNPTINRDVVVTRPIWPVHCQQQTGAVYHQNTTMHATTAYAAKRKISSELSPEIMTTNLPSGDPKRMRMRSSQLRSNCSSCCARDSISEQPSLVHPRATVAYLASVREANNNHLSVVPSPFKYGNSTLAQPNTTTASTCNVSSCSRATGLMPMPITRLVNRPQSSTMWRTTTKLSPDAAPSFSPCCCRKCYNTMNSSMVRPSNPLQGVMVRPRSTAMATVTAYQPTGTMRSL